MMSGWRTVASCQDERGASLLDDLVRDLRHGGRLLRRYPGFTAVATLTLAIAIGATLTVFCVVDAWMFRPLNFPQAERLAISFAARPERPDEPAVWLPYRVYLGWRERSHSFRSVSAAFVRDVTLTSDADTPALLGLNVTPEFFQTFGVDPLSGRTLSEGDVSGPRTMVLSYGLWQRRFGGALDAIGSTVTLSGLPHQIVGVMPREFDTRVLDMRFEFWTAIRAGAAGYGPDGAGPVTVIGRLREDTSIESARSELARITREVEAQYPVNFNRFVATLASLQADNTRTVRTTLWTISAAVATLLLIAGMNVGALLLGRGLARMREAAIRAAIGSGRARLVRQFLTESALIALLGGIAGCALAVVAVRLFASWNPLGTMPANAIQLDGRVLAAACAAMAVTAIVSGLVPALRLSNVNPYEALKAGGERGHATVPAQRAQVTMLVAQMTGCVVMLLATTLLVRTFERLHAEPLGFDARDLSAANVILPNEPFDSSEERNMYYEQLAARLRGITAVRAVAAGTSPPLSSGAPVSVNTGTVDAADALRISAQEVTEEFFETLRIPIVAGRPFDNRDRAAGAPVAILNTRAAQELFGSAEAAIGRRVRLDKDPWREIVGVVGAVRSSFFNTLEWKSDPIVYRPATQAFSALSNPTATSFGFVLHIRSDHPLGIADVRREALGVSPLAAVTSFRTASAIVSDATRLPAFRMTLLSWLAAASLLLAGMGVYGLISQTAARRRREVAIRLALGATPAGLLARIVAGALAVGGVGVALGGVAALAMGRTFKAVLYSVRPGDAWSFIVVAAILLAVTAIAAFGPAFRTTRMDPAQVLRAD